MWLISHFSRDFTLQEKKVTVLKMLMKLGLYNMY